MIKVASYNMHKGIGTDRRRVPERTLEVLREIDADVIALQEADRRFGTRAQVISARLLDHHSDWQTVPLGRKTASMGWHGNALLIRKSARIVECDVIHLPALEPRGAVMADIRLDTGIVRIVGMHLDLSGLWRRRQAQAIIAQIAARSPQYPTVLMGDLNEWSATLGCLREFMRHFTLAETGPSFHTRRPIARLDRIMVSSDMRIIDCGVHHSNAAGAASDHLPVWATVERG
jgi:endonuclease/exonuclease/phosphatase family metal-dependent hydrolase